MRPTNDQCLHRFGIEAHALGVECHVEGSVAGVHERLAALIDGRRVLSWDPEQLPYEAAAIVTGAVLGDAPREVQAGAEIGVTGCEAAVAETGSLVMFSRKGRSRAASLLPPVHVAIVERSRVHYSMAEVFEIYRELLEGAASCTFITGPSRSSDFVLKLTVGIHGPGRVVVFVGP
jgi:L-lactate dehydrogenase complex protein LldG